MLLGACVFYDLQKLLEYHQTVKQFCIQIRHSLAFIPIFSSIAEHQSVVRNTRKEEVVLARLRLGHTRVKHSYLLLGEKQPQCVGCNAPFTVRHFLLECGDFAQIRNNCFHVENMKQLFQDIHIDSIMTF